jgi:hypothetical protein
MAEVCDQQLIAAARVVADSLAEALRQRPLIAVANSTNT